MHLIIFRSFYKLYGYIIGQELYAQSIKIMSKHTLCVANKFFKFLPDLVSNN